jgi:transcriptional regulator with XRE-family HTH domain
MNTKNALDIIKKRLDKNSELKKAYLEEEKNYHIACKIREYRKAAGLTQKKLAQLIETKQSVISRIEHAEYKGHSLSILKKIAAALNIKIEDLILIKRENYQILSLHIPPVLKKAASFQNWNPNQIMVKRSYA